VVRVCLLEKDRIDHDSAVDGYLDRLSFAHIEGVASVLTMVNAHQGYKLSTAFDKTCFDLVLVRMVLERKGVKRVDPLHSTELQNGKLDWGLPERFAIEIHVVTLKVKVFHPVVHCPLFAEMILDTPRLACTKTGGVNRHIGFEKRPEQIVGDFVALKKRGEAFGCGGIGRLHEVDQ